MLKSEQCWLTLYKHTCGRKLLLHSSRTVAPGQRKTSSALIGGCVGHWGKYRPHPYFLLMSVSLRPWRWCVMYVRYTCVLSVRWTGVHVKPLMTYPHPDRSPASLVEGKPSLFTSITSSHLNGKENKAFLGWFFFIPLPYIARLVTMSQFRNSCLLSSLWSSEDSCTGCWDSTWKVYKECGWKTRELMILKRFRGLWILRLTLMKLG